MQPFRFLIEAVDSPQQIRGQLLCGQIVSGDDCALAPSGQPVTVASVELSEPQSTITFTTAASASPDDLLVAADARPEFAAQFEAELHWLNQRALLPGRSYRLQASGGATDATISRLKYRLQSQSQSAETQIAAKVLEQGQRGVANLALARDILYDPYQRCAATGSFRLLDRDSDEIIATGRITHGLRRASNVHWQALDVNKQTRAAIKQQTPKIIWLTGLSGSGKSTIANALERRLIDLNKHSYLLDGDNIRHGLNKDLGFTDADRVENIRRVAETARLMLDAGLIVITSFISPFRAERDMARALFEPGEFIEVYVQTPLEVCEQRDPKGLYRKARRGEIKHFTGLDSPYEAPTAAELTVDTASESPEQAAETILALLQSR